MDAFEKFWFFVKRFFFPIVLMLTGIWLIIVGISQQAKSSVEVALGEDPSNTLTQTTYFMYGAIALLVVGIISLYFILQKKLPATIVFGLAAVAAIGVFLLGKFNWNSVEERIIYLDQVDKSKELAKLGLEDIQKLQEAHKKNYDGYAPSFDSLVKFAKTDSISILTKAVDDLPSTKMTMDQARQLGYKFPKEIWTEEDALKLGLIVREYDKVPVAEHLFSKEKIDKEDRLYPFDLAKIEVQRTIDSTEKKFIIQTNEIDTTSVGVRVLAMPPYGPQVPNDVEDTLQIGSLTEVKMNSNWR